jgi:tetratricopeptide (TPR) repeat protein
VTNIALLGFALGVLAGVSALLLLASVGVDRVRPGGRSKALAALAFSIPLLALVLFAENARQPGDSMADGTTPPPVVAGSQAGQEDWSLIAHMYLGGPPPGGVGDSVASPAAAPDPHTVEEMTALTAREPGNAGAWLALAAAQRRSRDFAKAAASYERALRLDERNADAWADYADALASAAGRRLAGAPAEAIGRALKLDARHAKALWLQASLDLEQRRYADALTHWQALRTALPAGSPDITIVDANIDEARQLAAQVAGGR